MSMMERRENDQKFPSLQETVVKSGTGSVKITLVDARTIRQVLIKAIKQSDLGDRDALLAFAEPVPAWIPSEGLVLVGGWRLGVRNGQIVATYRLSQTEDRAVGYAAYVIKDREGWSITAIVPEKIAFR